MSEHLAPQGNITVMSDFRVSFRRGDTGAVVERRVQAGSATAARAVVEARGHTVIEVGDSGGVSLADESDHAPAARHPRMVVEPSDEVVALLRSIDERIARVERSSIVTHPRSTIGWGVLVSYLLLAIIGGIIGIVGAVLGAFVAVSSSASEGLGSLAPIGIGVAAIVLGVICAVAWRLLRPGVTCSAAR